MRHRRRLVVIISVLNTRDAYAHHTDYPITSSIAAESRLWQSRSRLIMLTFSFYTLGIFAAGVAFLVLLAIFKGAVDGNLDRLEYVWRLLLGLGIIPALFTMRARLKMSASRTFEQCKRSILNPDAAFILTCTNQMLEAATPKDVNPGSVSLSISKGSACSFVERPTSKPSLGRVLAGFCSEFASWMLPCVTRAER